jgi:PncC family amidohydrolase
MLGVPEATIAEHGAVSSAVAEAMARGVCRATGARLGVSTTGIAGPDGATSLKPLGLAWIGICLNDETVALQLNVRGSRGRVMDRVGRCALHWARMSLRSGLDSLPAQHRM